MALIVCNECGREISDQAPTCPGCGSPVVQGVNAKIPERVTYNHEYGVFIGTMPLMVNLAMKAIQDFGYKIDQVNDAIGFVSFRTGISLGSWSGVSCSLHIQKLNGFYFQVTGTGKQNISGAQLAAINIGNEAKGKAQKVIQQMIAISSR